MENTHIHVITNSANFNTICPKYGEISDDIELEIIEEHTENYNDDLFEYMVKFTTNNTMTGRVDDASDAEIVDIVSKLAWDDNPLLDDSFMFTIGNGIISISSNIFVMGCEVVARLCYMIRFNKIRLQILPNSTNVGDLLVAVAFTRDYMSTEEILDYFKDNLPAIYNSIGYMTVLHESNATVMYGKLTKSI